jgi:hypothetical protein
MIDEVRDDIRLYGNVERQRQEQRDVRYYEKLRQLNEKIQRLDGTDKTPPKGRAIPVYGDVKPMDWAEWFDSCLIGETIKVLSRCHGQIMLQRSSDGQVYIGPTKAES